MKDSTTSPKSPRPTMETSAARGFRNSSAEPSKHTTLVKKKGAQAGDPTAQAKPSRSNVLSPNAKGRNGATYGIRVGFQASVSPEAGATQANGRIIGPAMNRQRPSFQEGIAE